MKRTCNRKFCIVNIHVCDWRTQFSSSQTKWASLTCQPARWQTPACSNWLHAETCARSTSIQSRHRTRLSLQQVSSNSKGRVMPFYIIMRCVCFSFWPVCSVNHVCVSFLLVVRWLKSLIQNHFYQVQCRFVSVCKWQIILKVIQFVCGNSGNVSNLSDTVKWQIILKVIWFVCGQLRKYL